MKWKQSYEGEVHHYSFQYRDLAIMIFELLTTAAKFYTTDGSPPVNLDYVFNGVYGEPCTSDIMKQAEEVLIKDKTSQLHVGACMFFDDGSWASKLQSQT